MLITADLLLNGMSDKGGWNSEQMKLLGIDWPPPHGWRHRLRGRHISEEDAKRFLELKGQKFRKQRMRKIRAQAEKIHKPTLKEEDSFIVYCDGGCVRPRKAGAWAYIVLRNGSVVSEKAMSYHKTTNNRMELLGAIAGITSLDHGEKAIVRSDSQYVVNGIELGWAKAWARRGFRMGRPGAETMRPNWDLWEMLLASCQTRTVRFEWIKGHNGNALNEKCDSMAEMAMKVGPHSDDIVFARLLAENGGKW